MEILYLDEAPSLHVAAINEKKNRLEGNPRQCFGGIKHKGRNIVIKEKE